MAVRLLPLLLGVVLQVGQWEIVTPDNQVNHAEIDRWSELLEDTEDAIEHFFMDRIGVRTGSVGVLRVRVAPSSGDFAAWTGCSVWQGAALLEGEIVTQPLSVLEMRGVAEQVVIHECVHLALEPYNVPLWLNEGLAVLCSGQVRTLGGEKHLPDSIEEIEELLLSSDTSSLRIGYLAAAALTSKKINELGRDSLITLIVEEEL
ncbi:hypothetical protein GF359_00620 [candidate division WOR-3 bacterium]|uniref:Uncharacterized protein n=1 Tax=candidate division WOR-3 bacterium TaxID=2052148 RepID=A0A9D5K963_UNCW3|nr:hypothetical protein [candidate division WOR-3 bacterium]MBD3363696.1 hypothetical protein [candidate division WOR-3 bacterium]